MARIGVYFEILILGDTAFRRLGLAPSRNNPVVSTEAQSRNESLHHLPALISSHFSSDTPPQEERRTLRIKSGDSTI